MNENKRLRQELEGHTEKALRIQKVKDPDIFVKRKMWYIQTLMGHPSEDNKV